MRTSIDQSTKILRPLRSPQERQEVAAVCYRIRKRGIQFLLVQTRGKRWIFPKGGAKRGMTLAQSAALEAFEEAGVHGRIEELPFARYFRRKPDIGERSSDTGLAVMAHLCEVSRLETPQERNRNPTWFSAHEAKNLLLEERTPEFGDELGRVIDRALLLIHRLHSAPAHTAPHRAHKDGLREVRFEAGETQRFLDHPRKAAIARYFGRLFQIGVPAEIRPPVLRLSTGAPAEISRKITAIDSRRKAKQLKPGSVQLSKRK